MGKIEIHDLNQLIKMNYPAEYVKKIIDDVFLISILVKEDYPDYKEWFISKQVPGIYEGSRNIIVAHIDAQIVGFVSLKKDELEKKICTFYVAKFFRKNKVGDLLSKKAMEWLECDKPLITIPNDKLYNFIRLSKKFGWTVTEIKDGLYRTNNPEIVLNGSIKENGLGLINSKVKTKSITHIWFFYYYNKFIKPLSSKLISIKVSGQKFYHQKNELEIVRLFYEWGDAPLNVIYFKGIHLN